MQPQPQPQPTDWKVLYGDRLQFHAYFDDRAKAERYAATHAGRVVPLAPVTPQPQAADPPT